jgi:hypothetical protein
MFILVLLRIFSHILTLPKSIAVKGWFSKDHHMETRVPPMVHRRPWKSQIWWLSWIMIDYLFTVHLPLKNVSIRWRCHHCRWGLQHIGPGPFGREGSLSYHTYCDTGLRFFCLIEKTAPFSQLLGHTKGYKIAEITMLWRMFSNPDPLSYMMVYPLGPPFSRLLYDTNRSAEDLFLPGSSRVQKRKKENIVRPHAIAPLNKNSWNETDFYSKQRVKIALEILPITLNTPIIFLLHFCFKT